MKEHLLQPRGSNLCGQTCVAMLTETTLEKAILLVGKKGLTRPKDLIQALQKTGFLARGPVILSASADIHCHPLPENAILNYHWEGRSNGHWIVRWQGENFDPEGGTARGGRVTSYIEICKL